MVSAKSTQNACRVVLGDDCVRGMVSARMPLPDIARVAALEAFVQGGTGLAAETLRDSIRRIRAGEYLDGDVEMF